MPGPRNLIFNSVDQIRKLPPAEETPKLILRSSNQHPRMSFRVLAEKVAGVKNR
jgi:hypothetical protein